MLSPNKAIARFEGEREVNDNQPTDQGRINIPFHFDARWAERIKLGRNKTFYPKPNNTQTRDMMNGEIIFANAQDNKTNFTGWARGMTTLNGLGEEALDKYKGDENAQREFIKQGIEIIGFMRANVKMTDNLPQGIAAQIKGINFVTAHVDIPYGSYIYADVPSMLEAKNMSKNLDKGSQLDKITLIAKPLDYKTALTRYTTEMSRYLMNAELYKSSLRTSPNDVHPNVASLVNKNNEDLTKSLVMLDILVRSGVIKNLEFSEEIYDLTRDGSNPTQDNVLLGIGQALGVLGKQSYNIDGIYIDRTKQLKYDELRRDILRAQNYEPSIMPANYAFGHNSQGDNGNAGINPITGKIKTTTAHGKMLQNQSTFWKVGLGSLFDREREFNRFILGKVTKGAEQGHKAELVR